MNDESTVPGGTVLDGAPMAAEDQAPSPGAATPTRFPIDLPAFTGSLEQLVVRAQRGEIDLTEIPVAEITAAYRREWARLERPDLRDMADFLGLVSRLINLKALAVLPDPSASSDDGDDEAIPETDAGRRLSEYRLFKAAAEALLAEAAEEGARSFLSMVAPDVVPVERLRIPPERLAAAFRAVLERLTEVEPLPIGTVTFSVAEMGTRLRDRLQSAGTLRFEEIFAGVSSRLEAVAIFLALLEMLRDGLAQVDQPEAFGPITVTNCG